MSPGPWKPLAESLERTEHKIYSWGAIFEVSMGHSKRITQNSFFPNNALYTGTLSTTKKEKEGPRKVFGALGVPR